MASGIYDGLLDVYVARMTGADSASSTPAYSAPVVLGMGIAVTITPVYAKGELYASNRKARQQSKIIGYTVSINTDAVDRAMVAYAVGRTTDKAGVQVVNGNSAQGDIALGFARTKDNGKKEFWWLHKGKLSEMAVDAKTRSGSIEYQTPKLGGEFSQRICDGSLAAIADEEDSSIAASVFANWFSQVYEPDGTGEPTADSLPIGKVIVTATLPNSGIDPTAVYVLTAVDGEHASGTMWRQVSGAWAQYGAN